jgi:hypothetical protein
LAPALSAPLLAVLQAARATSVRLEFFQLH